MTNKIKLSNMSNRYSKTTENSKKGFTLIELVVVIAIMDILALIMVPNLTAYVDKADQARGEANVRTIHAPAMMAFNIDKINPNSDNTEFKSKFQEYAGISDDEMAKYSFEMVSDDNVMIVRYQTKDEFRSLYDGRGFDWIHSSQPTYDTSKKD